MEEAFEALNSGDYTRAVRLLEAAANRTAYASDPINHAYTLALYRAGERARLADVAFRVGTTLTGADPASAMDYFQRAVQAGLDEQRIRRIAEIHEAWAGDRRTGKLHGNVSRAGHLVSSLARHHPAAEYVRMLARSLGERGIEPLIFTTEANASWFVNPAAAPVTPDSLSGWTEACVLVASVDGDFAERAERVAASIRECGLQLVFYHAGLSDQIAARVAALMPSPVQVAVNHEMDVFPRLFDGFIYLWQNALKCAHHDENPSEWIPPTSEVDRQTQTAAFESRESLGIESAGTVSATFSGPTRDQREFARSLIEIMRRHPRHYHLFAGNADVRAFRGLFHSEGVLPRMRFLGGSADTIRLLAVIDLYLAPFPNSGRVSIVDIMAAGKPVVALLDPAGSESNAASALAPEPELMARTPVDYVQVADRLIRDAEARLRLGDRLYEIFRTDFSPARMGERYVAFLDRLR